MTQLPQPRTDHGALAARALRAHADERWVEISGRVLTNSLNVSRRSMPVRASSSGGRVDVSEQVLIAHVRQALDQVVGATPVEIQIRADEKHRYTGLLITLEADFGEPLLPVADEVRHRAKQVLDTLLGPVEPPVTVTAMHIHVDDVRTPRGGSVRDHGGSSA